MCSIRGTVDLNPVGSSRCTMAWLLCLIKNYAAETFMFICLFAVISGGQSTLSSLILNAMFSTLTARPLLSNVNMNKSKGLAP